MSRYIGPSCRVCRRAGVKLFLKGERCYAPKCAVERRNAPPGPRAQRRRRISDRGAQLREKQKARFAYGMMEGQFRTVFAKAERQTGITGENLVKLLELRSRRPLPVELPVSHRKITVVLDVPADPEKLMKSFEAKLRSQVRRPAKEGITVRFGPDQVAPFFEVFARHMRDLGTPTQSRRLFERIVEVFPDTWVGCAWLGDVPVAGGVGFGVGAIFGHYLAAALRNPSAAQGQFGNLIFGFAVTEALGIFSLLIALLLLFAL